MIPIEFYTQYYKQQETSLRTSSRIRNWLTTTKLLLFAAIVYGIIRLIATQNITIWLSACGFLIILFISLTVWDNRVVNRIAKLKTLIRCCQTEIKYLNGDWSALNTGKQFTNPTHAYALDLDLFGEQSLFQSLNRTATTHGCKLLADWLLNPELDDQRILARQQAAAELSNKPEWMLNFQATGLIHSITEEDNKIAQKWLQEPCFFHNSHAKKVLYLSNGICILLWILTILSVIPYGYALCAFFVQLGVLAYYLKRINRISKITDRFSKVIGTYNHLVKQIVNTPFSSPELQQLQQTLIGTIPADKALRSLNRILDSFDQRNNVLVAIVMNGLYLKDLHHIIQFDRWRETHRKQVTSWFDTIHQFDALTSMGFYRYNHPTYCTPTISNQHLLHAEEMGHPLLPDNGKVCNDFEVAALHDIYIVTGANMAGKSTFLRTVGVNLVLALSGNVVCSRTFAFQPMRLFTSMRTTDNLAKGTSYFHAELLRLQQLVQTAEQSQKTFCILDEMLKGTNSQDKLNGSRKFLHKLQTLPVAGLVATHDLALGELAQQDPKHFHNICFEIDHSGKQIVYDYKLRPGVSRNMNASILLEQMGLI